MTTMRAAEEGEEELFVRSIARPALEYMNEEQLNNLERVLALNRSTMQTFATCYTEGSNNNNNPTAPCPTPTIPSHQYNQYLYNSLQSSPEPLMSYPSMPQSLEVKPPTSSVPTTQTAAPQAFAPAPYIQYPFLPFWSACPLPFSPLAYPQIILPQAFPPQQIGPQILRPVPVLTTGMPFAAPAPHPQTQTIPKSHTYATPSPIAPRPPQTPPVSSTLPSSPVTTFTTSMHTPSSTTGTDREYKIDKYRDKRSKRNWSRNPDPKLSRMAQERLRDQSGKFVSVGDRAVQELQQELYEMKQHLLRTEQQLDELREMNLRQHDDMYFRSVNNINVHAVQPFQVHQQTLAQSGVIYSPFRGGNTAVEAFKEKIDLRDKRDSLKKTHSPFLPPGQQPQHGGESIHHVGEIDASWPQYLPDDRWGSPVPTDDVHQTAQWVDQILNTTSSDEDEDMGLEP
eukprot:TRINITY_DN720_c5_g1_i1.p1 TRINITY_DN720_c5_g1~~TRINITY_DN720_c5_g1_i1.p1  ORF type:complete len:454 (+),score=80.11 TRINITY_DN720_c5_g1_i1:357-1718(+)